MSITLKWGLITGMVYVIFSLVSNMLGLSQGGGGMSGMGMLVNLLLFGATFFTLYMGIRETRDEALKGYLNMGQSIRTGMGIALIAALMGAVFSILYMKVIDPGMVDKIMATAEEQWDQQNMGEEGREMARKWMGYFLNPFLLAGFMIVWVSFWGLIKSLIAGMLLKREAPPTVPIA